MLCNLISKILTMYYALNANICYLCTQSQVEHLKNIHCLKSFKKNLLAK